MIFLFIIQCTKYFKNILFIPILLTRRHSYFCVHQSIFERYIIMPCIRTSLSQKTDINLNVALYVVTLIPAYYHVAYPPIEIRLIQS